MIKKESKNIARQARHKRIRKIIKGTKETPRLNIFRSNTAIYAQIINDETNETLASASSLDMKLKENNIKTATAVGIEIAKKAKDLKIKKVVFDRGGYLYHGKIKVLAEAARENGLEF